MTFKLSPSTLNLMHECSRCFWLSTHKVWSRPAGIFPSLPSGMDGILKTHFDKFMEKDKLPPELCNNSECANLKLFDNEELLKEWRNSRKGLWFEDKDGNILHGGIDNLLINKKNNKFIVLDYKTRGFPLKENDIMKIGLKGIIDLQATKKEGSEFVIIDYKTSNSIDKGENFERQALFYNMLLHKKKNIIPSKTIFHYLKLNAVKEHVFSLEDVEEFKEELNRIADQLLDSGTDIKNYPIGEINDIFNSKRQACLEEIERRQRIENSDYTDEINAMFY